MICRVKPPNTWVIFDELLDAQLCSFCSNMTEYHCCQEHLAMICDSCWETGCCGAIALSCVKEWHQENHND